MLQTHGRRKKDRSRTQIMRGSPGPITKTTKAVSPNGIAARERKNAAARPRNARARNARASDQRNRVLDQITGPGNAEQ